MRYIKLHHAVAEVAPVVGISVPNADDRTTWIIHFADTATPEQRDTARAVMLAYDMDALPPAAPEPIGEFVIYGMPPGPSREAWNEAHQFSPSLPPETFPLLVAVAAKQGKPIDVCAAEISLGYANWKAATVAALSA